MDKNTIRVAERPVNGLLRVAEACEWIRTPSGGL